MPDFGAGSPVSSGASGSGGPDPQGLVALAQEVDDLLGRADGGAGEGEGVAVEGGFH